MSRSKLYYKASGIEGQEGAAVHAQHLQAVLPGLVMLKALERTIPAVSEGEGTGESDAYARRRIKLVGDGGVLESRL